MKTINRDKIQRMVGDRYGGGGSRGESADLDGYASQIWVNQNFVSKKFFARLFTINGTDENDDAVVVEPNDLDTDITDIQLMFGAWTEHYLSALGIGSGGSGGGGGGGTILTEPLASINLSGIGSPTGANKVICWDGSRWTYKSVGEGSVSSVAMTVPEGFRVTGSAAHTITTSGTFSLTFGGSVTKNRVLASPAAADGAPSWRKLVADDIPDLSGKYVKKTDLDSYTWWGRTLQTSGQTKAVYGDIENAANIKIDNDKKISWKQSGQTNYLSMLTLDTSNNFVVGESMANSGFSTYIRGRRVVFQSGTGSSGNHTATLDANGVLTVEKLVIGSITIEHDTTNGGLHIVGAGLYADTYISALSSGSGGCSGSGITMNDVWSALAATAPSSSSEQINPTHMTQALSNYYTKTQAQGTFLAQSGGTLLGTLEIKVKAPSSYGVTENCDSFVTSSNLWFEVGTGKNVYSNSTWNQRSDIRMKDVVETVDCGVESIAKAQIFNYRWKDEKDGNVMLGSSAQDWVKIFPKGVKMLGDTYTMDYAGIALASSVMAAREIVRLKKKVAELEEQL